MHKGVFYRKGFIRNICTLSMCWKCFWLYYLHICKSFFNIIALGFRRLVRRTGTREPLQSHPFQTVEWTCDGVSLSLLPIDVSHAESALLMRAPPRRLVALEHVINSLPFSQLKLCLQELLFPWRSEISVLIRMCHRRNKESLVSWICQYRSRCFSTYVAC